MRYILVFLTVLSLTIGLVPTVALAQDGLDITTPPLSCTVGVPYDFDLTATGGTPPYTWEMVDHFYLPLGLTMNAAGHISGIPQYPSGKVTLKFRVTDSSNPPLIHEDWVRITVDGTASVTVDAPETVSVGQVFTLDIELSDSDRVNRWSTKLDYDSTVIEVNSPAGGSAVSPGIINGKQSQLSQPWVFQATEAGDPENYKRIKLMGEYPDEGFELGYSTGSGTLFTVEFIVVGQPGNQTPIQLEQVLVVNQSGQTIPTYPGYDDDVDAAQITVLAMAITNPSLPDGEAGLPYSQTLQVSGGQAPFTWTSTGSLPSGLDLSPAGVISGTPTTAGQSSTVTFIVTDANLVTAQRDLSITIVGPPVISDDSLPDGIVGAVYSHSLSVEGGVAPYTFSLQDPLPSGLNFDNGAISGIPNTPTEPGNPVELNFNVTDSLGGTGSKTLNLAVLDTPLPLEITSASPLMNGGVAVPYSRTLQASGGIPGYTWSLLSGSLPAGLSLETNGWLHGEPTTLGQFEFTVQVMDSLGVTSSKPFTLTISNVVLTIVAPESAPAGSTFLVTASFSPVSNIFGWQLVLVYDSNVIQIDSLQGGDAVQRSALWPQGDWNSLNAPQNGGEPVGNKLFILGFASTPHTGEGVLFTARFRVLGAVDDYSDIIISQEPGEEPEMVDPFGQKVSDIGTVDDTIVVSGLGITTDSQLPVGEVGIAYSQSLAATGGEEPYTWSLVDGSLPPGLQLNGNTISGTPTTAGIFIATIQVEDAADSAVKDFSITIVNRPSIITDSLPDGALNTHYEFVLQAEDGIEPYTWTVQDGSALPGGLSLSPDGVISGEPDAVGSSSVAFVVTDSLGGVGVRALDLTINELPGVLEIITASLPGAIIGVDYSQQLEASGGATPYQWEVTSGSLPNGLSLNGATIAGTPTSIGDFPFEVTLTDFYGTSVIKDFSITVARVVVTISAPAIVTRGGTFEAEVAVSQVQDLLAFEYYVNYDEGIIQVDSVQGGDAVTLGAFAAGAHLEWNSIPRSIGSPPTGGTILISGDWDMANAKTGSGVLNKIRFRVLGNEETSSNLDLSEMKLYDLWAVRIDTATNNTIVTVGAINIITTGLYSGNVGAYYTDTLEASGGTGDYQWTITEGALPDGLILDDETGEIFGIPETAGDFPFTVTVTDTEGASDSEQFTITIADQIPLVITSTSPLANGIVDADYSVYLQAQGGYGMLTWTLEDMEGQSLPDGLSLSPAGQISGTPDVSGLFTFTAKVTDQDSPDPNSVSQEFSITVYDVLQITTASLPEGFVNEPYQEQLQYTGGIEPYNWTLVDDTELPADLILDANTGLISGTPTDQAKGEHNLKVRVTDGSGQQATAQYTLVINDEHLVITTGATLPVGEVTAPYSEALQASGGAIPYNYSWNSTDLPDWLTLETNGWLHGTPDVDGLFTFNATVTDSADNTASREFNLTVVKQINIVETTLEDGNRGSSYDKTLTTEGGVEPFIWNCTGDLPAGVEFNDGVFSGIPTVEGPFTFTVTVTDSKGIADSQEFTVNINAPVPPDITTTALPEGEVGVEYNQTVQYTGGLAPFTWNCTDSLPAGITFANGVFSGSPTESGTFDLTVSITDSIPITDSQDLTMTIFDALVISTASLPAGKTSTAYNQTLTVSGGKAPYTWSIVSGTLPDGLTFSPAGVISGTPTTATSTPVSITFKVTDSLGGENEKALDISITKKTTSSGGGGGGGSSSYTVSLTGMTSNLTVKLDSSAKVKTGAKLTTTDGKVTLTLPTGTKLNTASGGILFSLTASPLSSPPAAPAGNAIVLAYTFGPDGAKFVPAVTLTMSYDPAKIPAGVDEKTLYIAYFDGTNYQKLTSTVDTVNKTISAQIEHFTAFAVMATLPAPATTAPAATTPVAPPTTKPPAATTPAAPPTSKPPAVATTVPPPAQTTAAPTATPVTTTGGGTPWGMIIGIIFGVIIVGAIAFMLIRRKTATR